MDWNAIDWPALERLRDGFLAAGAAPADYWTSTAQLAAYDLTFAARIGWKWDFVLGELARRGWSPPPGAVLDWGCGTGVAARRFVHHFGPAAVPQVTLSWTSPPVASPPNAPVSKSRSIVPRRVLSRRAKARWPHFSSATSSRNSPRSSLTPCSTAPLNAPS
jgi:hypothetical protein